MGGIWGNLGEMGVRWVKILTEIGEMGGNLGVKMVWIWVKWVKSWEMWVK
jgi:hypothetical protein